MVEMRIEHEENESQGIARFAQGELREMLGKLAKDLIDHGVSTERADETVGNIYGVLGSLNGEATAGTAMVLQALRNIHRPKLRRTFADMPELSPHQLLQGALFAHHEAMMCFIAAEVHPETPPSVKAMIKKAFKAHQRLLPLVQEPMWATEAPDAADMEPAGNA